MPMKLNRESNHHSISRVSACGLALTNDLDHLPAVEAQKLGDRVLNQQFWQLALLNFAA